MKNILNKSSKKSSFPKYFEINGKMTADKKVVADAFNDFYINIGPSLSSSNDGSSGSPMDYMKNRLQNSIFIEPVYSLEIGKIIMSLKSSSPGWDDISAVAVKNTHQYLAGPLAYIFNLSFTHGTFPQELKIAKVVPLYKGENNGLVKNYRPVSVLPLFSKILERLMYNRLLAFINANGLLYKLQFGFRPEHSTNTALITLIDKISCALNDGETVLGVFLDFSKAFDCVNHEILLAKLEHYGIRGNALKWFHSYLTGRQQYVCYDGVNSTHRGIVCGVPQGSILGPVLFLLYINDLANVSDILYSILFADDSNVFISGKNIEHMINTMNGELAKLMIWLECNRLSLNIKKTHYMLFSTKKCSVPDHINITIKGIKVGQVDHTKFLGVIIDSKLSWDYHINYIKNKISKAIGLICKARKYVNKACLVTLYYSFLYPYLNYCIEVWGSAAQYRLQPLVLLHKRVIRILTSAGYRDHTAPLFKQLKIMTIYELYLFRTGLFMFKIYNKKVPTVCCEMFTTNEIYHSYNTRRRNYLHVPLAGSVCYSNTVRIKGVDIWNRILTLIDVDCSICVFKHKLKRVLTELYN